MEPWPSPAYGDALLKHLGLSKAHTGSNPVGSAFAYKGTSKMLKLLVSALLVLSLLLTGCNEQPKQTYKIYVPTFQSTK